jgi:xanthine/CO dehydrogenase XdhC/CoxF family maturation factor
MAVELRKLVKLWSEIRSAAEEVSVATVVRVAGSSYRKTGARMMVARGGQRVGTVSGGCLEAEVARKIWWLAEQGPVVRDYNTSYDDDSKPSYGLGCDGVVTLLLERVSPTNPLFDAMRQAVENRAASAIVTVIGTTNPEAKVGARFIVDDKWNIAHSDDIQANLRQQMQSIATSVLGARSSASISTTLQGAEIELFAEYLAPPPALFLFGAGDDAQPVARLADAMGWEVAVADGRSHLATKARFPAAQRVATLDLDDPASALEISPGDAAVVLTHSYLQDAAILRALLPLDLGYLGVLGPRRRTERILAEVAPGLGMNPEAAMRRLRSPVGLDLGSGFPEVIALSIVSEIQSVLTQRSAIPLHFTASGVAVPAHR